MATFLLFSSLVFREIGSSDRGAGVSTLGGLEVSFAKRPFDWDDLDSCFDCGFEPGLEFRVSTDDLLFSGFAAGFTPEALLPLNDSSPVVFLT